MKESCRDEVTITILRIIELMRSSDVDADIIQLMFIGDITEYELELAERENIQIMDIS